MKVVLIAINGLNCHWLGPYGNEWVSTPNLDQFASESIVFDRYFASPADLTLLHQCLPMPVRRNLTCLHVDDSKFARPLEEMRAFRTRPAEFATPAEALLAALDEALEVSFDCLFLESDRLIPPWDFEFETYQSYAETSGGFVEDREGSAEPPIDEPVPGRIDLNDLALWHRLHNSFAAAVHAFDQEWKAISDRLKAKGLGDSAAWIFTSPLGWPLGEHGIVGPADSRLHEELVHLPLIVRMPGSRGSLRRIPALTQAADLVGLIGELLELETSSAEFPAAFLNQRDHCRLANSIRTDDWAYLAPTNGLPPRLYHKPDDIWEANDLGGRHPDECDRLESLLHAEAEGEHAVR